jgi:hypothetical protein
MANSDKDIRVVPNRNKSGLPNIAFTGYNNDPIVLNVLDDNTISFEGSSGQLFSVSNAVTTGTIFSVNDISGIPSFRVDADGTVGIAEFSGNVGIGLQSPQSKLSVGGDINVGAGYTFRVAGTKVLDSSSLGTGVTGSSLTSVGTISSGTWQGTAIGVNYGGTGATNASDARSFIGAATAGTNSDITRLLGVQHLFVTIPTAAAIGITVKAATSQSASMMEFVNSSNSLLAWITKDGTFAHGAYFTHNDGRVPGISVQRANAAGIVARGFNSDAFPAIEVQNNPGGLSVGLYPSGLVYGGVLQAWASTASTNTTTGALIVAGGAAIAGTTNFGRDVRIFSSLASSSPFTGSLVVSGGVGISNNLFVGGGVAFTSSIASTSTTTGTLVVTGGVGIGGSVFTSTSNASSISGVVLSNGSVTLTGTYTQSNSSTTAFQVRDGSNNPAFVIDTIGDIISLPVAVASTSTGTGSLVVAGGVGIGGSLYTGSINVSNDLTHLPYSTTIGGASGWSYTNIPVAFTFLNNKYVGTAGTYVYYSDDLVNWSSVMVPQLDPTRNISNIAYGDGKYVFVQYYTSNAGYSTNLVNWTKTSMTYNTWLRVVYGNGRFVADSGGTNYAYSLDGVTWTTVTDSKLGYGQTLQFINGYFYSCNSNTIARSVDGINWQACNTTAIPYGLAYGNGLYVGGVYNSGTIVYSYDGLNFSTYSGTSYVHNNSWFYNGIYYLTTNNDNAIRYSTDGFNWSIIGGFPAAVNNLYYHKGRLYASSGSSVWMTNATPGRFEINPYRTGNLDNVEIGRIAPNNANFIDVSVNNNLNVSSLYNSTLPQNGALTVAGGVGIGQSVNIGGKLDVSNTINYTATNSGIANTWTRIAIPSPVSISGLTYGNGLYVGVGYSAATSTDGITWTARSLPHNLTGVGYGNGLYVGVLSASSLGATSTDGITWRSMALPSSVNWNKVAYGNGIYVASSDSTTVAYSYNGFQWTATGLESPGGFSQLTPVEFGGGYFIIRGNASSSYWISADGINWTRRTNFTTNNVATNSIAYGDGAWVLAGSSASLAFTKDLLNFTYSSHYGWSGYFNYIAYTNGTFAIVDTNSLQCTLIYKNLTSINASYLPGPTAASTITAGEGKFVAGAGSTVYVTDIASHTFNIFPHNSGEINNVRIGAKYPSSAQFSHLNANNLVSFGSSSPSTSKTTGALVVTGGVGIGGSLFVGNTLSVASSTASTSTTTGALIVSGGVGISGSINASDVVRSGQLIAPTFTLSALGNTGALSPSTTYYYKLSSLDYFGNESLPSNEVSIALNSSTYAVNIAPNIDQSIYAIKIYRTTTSNSYTNSLVDTYYPFRGAYNASTIPYNYYDRGKSTSSSSPVTVSTANRAVLGSSINSTLGKLNLAGQLLVQSKNASAPSANIGIQLGNYDIAAVKDGLLAYFSSITSATGGTLTAGTRYYYVMTGVDSYGNETFPSKEFPFLADANGAAQLNIAGGDYGIIKYRFYRTTNPGNYTNCYIGELPGYIDINYPTQNASPPTSSSANAYVLKSTPAENIPSYIDSLDVRPGMSGAVRKLADNQYNTLSGIVTSGIAGTLSQNTNYFYKVASYDRYGNTSSASIPYLINTGPATSVQLTPTGVDWPAGVEGYLVYRSTSKDNFTNVPTFYAYPGTAITDIGNYEFISSAPTYNNYLLGNFGGYYYGYANFYVRSLDIAAGGNQSSMNFLSGRSPQPTLSAATGGTLTPGDVYYYKVMAFGRGDDYSMASPAVRFVIGSGGAARISVSNIGITGFRHYNIYRTADLSNWTNSQIARYVSESDFVDIGYPGTSGSPVGHSGSKRGTSATISDGAITALTARINSFTQDIAAPGGITISGTTGGILTTNTTYYYRIMAVGVSWSEFGQASKQVIYTTTDTQNAISLSWGLVPNATGYRVLRSTTNNSGSGQTYTFVHGTSFVDKGYSTTTHPYDPYALYYPGSYGATISAIWNRYHLPFLNITNGENPALTVSMLPPIISSTSTGTGGTLENNTNYYYIVEAYDYNGGSSLPSTEVVVNTGANNSVTLTWTEKNGAFYHKVYRSSNSDFTNKQINQTVYTNTFTDINYPTVNTSPRYSSTNGSMYRIGTVNTSGVYHGLFSRSVFQTTPTPQGAYGTDYAVRVAGRPASSIYGALFELGDFLSTGYNGSNLGTYFGLSSATGFTGNFIDLQASSISRFKVDYLGNATIGSTTGSGSTSTGALVISGGVGIGQSLFTSISYSSSISGAIFSNGSATLSGTFTQNNSSTTAFQVRDGSNNPAFVIDTIADIISLPVAVASTSTGTGSLVVAGGVGIGGSLFVGNNSSIGGTLNIAGNSSIGGTLSVSGNASVGGTLNISGNASIGGTLNVSGTNSYFQNNLYVGNNTQGRLYFSQATLGSAGTTVIPTMAFIGATNSPITLSVLPDNSLSFDGSSGQLFSINNNLSTGWIFSINDISGLPIFRTNADLTVAMGEYGGNVGIGLSNPTFKLQVSGNAGISGTTLISNTTGSSSSTSGALVVSGGVGIGGSLFTATGNTSSISGVTFYNNRAQNGFTINGASAYSFNIQDPANNQRLNYHADSNRTEFTGNNAVHEIRLIHSNNSAYTGFKSNSSGTVTYILPPGDGNPGQVLYTNGAAGLAWTTQSGGSSNVNAGLIYEIAHYASAGSSVSGSSSFTNDTSAGKVSITHSTASTSSSTGAFVVSGGVGIGGTAFVAGNLRIQSSTASTNSATGSLQVAGGVGISGQLSFNQASMGQTGILTNPSIAFIGTTGSPIIMSVLSDNSLSWEGTSGQLFSIDNNLTTGEIFAVSDISGLPIISAYANQNVIIGEFGGNVAIGISNPAYKLHVSGSVGFTSGTASTNTTTGALIVTGGVAVGSTVNIGGRLNLWNGSNYTGLVSAASGNTVYTLPATSPGAGTSYLTSNSSGVMSWTAPNKANYVLSFGAGFTPTADSADSVSLNIPYSPDGTSKYYYVKRIEYRNETLSGGTGLSFYLQRHTSGNAAWSTTNTITAGSGASFYVGPSVYSASFTTIASSAGVAGSVVSGDYVRLYFTGVGSAANVSIAMTIEEQ